MNRNQHTVARVCGGGEGKKHCGDGGPSSCQSVVLVWRPLKWQCVERQSDQKYLFISIPTDLLKYWTHLDPTRTRYTNGSIMLSCIYQNRCTYWTYLYFSGRPKRLRVACWWLRSGEFGSTHPSLLHIKIWKSLATWRRSLTVTTNYWLIVSFKLRFVFFFVYERIFNLN